MTDEAISPLRRRMIEDMTIRNLAPKTQHDYIRNGSRTSPRFLGARPILRAGKMSAATSCIWHRAVWARQRSTAPSRRCGSSSM